MTSAFSRNWPLKQRTGEASCARTAARFLGEGHRGAQSGAELTHQLQQFARARKRTVASSAGGPILAEEQGPPPRRRHSGIELAMPPTCPPAASAGRSLPRVVRRLLGEKTPSSSQRGTGDRFQGDGPPVTHARAENVSNYDGEVNPGAACGGFVSRDAGAAWTPDRFLRRVRRTVYGTKRAAAARYGLRRLRSLPLAPVRPAAGDQNGTEGAAAVARVVLPGGRRAATAPSHRRSSGERPTTARRCWRWTRPETCFTGFL